MKTKFEYILKAGTASWHKKWGWLGRKSIFHDRNNISFFSSETSASQTNDSSVLPHDVPTRKKGMAQKPLDTAFC